MSAVQPRTLYRALYRELNKQHRAASKEHNKVEMKKLEALQKYRQMKARAAGLEESSVEEIKPPQIKPYNSTTLRDLFFNHKHTSSSEQSALVDEKYSTNVAEFLVSQRMYSYLLQYYNGSTIDEDKRIELSARRVGLELPEDYIPPKP